MRPKVSGRIAEIPYRRAWWIELRDLEGRFNPGLFVRTGPLSCTGTHLRKLKPSEELLRAA